MSNIDIVGASFSSFWPMRAAIKGNPVVLEVFLSRMWLIGSNSNISVELPVVVFEKSHPAQTHLPDPERPESSSIHSFVHQRTSHFSATSPHTHTSNTQASIRDTGKAVYCIIGRFRHITNGAPSSIVGSEYLYIRQPFISKMPAHHSSASFRTSAFQNSAYK